MISSEYTLAKSAFASHETLTPFLNELDESEQKILAQEEKEYKIASKENARTGALVGQLACGFFAAIYWGIELKNGSINVKKFLEDFVIPVSYFYYMGFMFGEFLCNTSPSKKNNIELRRKTRLDEKIQKLKEELKKETNENQATITYVQLQKAHDFFEKQKKINHNYFNFWKKS